MGRLVQQPPPARTDRQLASRRGGSALLCPGRGTGLGRLTQAKPPPRNPVRFTGVHLLGLAFDLILLSAVWMHVPPSTRARAFRKLATLLKPGGVILMSLREGPSEPDRPMWPVPPGEVEAFARMHGLAVLRSVSTADQLGRANVRWTGMCLRLPDDGAGALPLLRGVILNDEKSSTYKIGLLRAVARVADATPALAVPRLDEDAVEVPLGVVALNWVRM